MVLRVLIADDEPLFAEALAALPADIAKARGAGAAGYITKDRIAERLVEATLDAAELP